MLQRQEVEAEQDWEAGLSDVQLTPDGSIMPVGTGLRSSKLLPVVEDEDEEVSPVFPPSILLYSREAPKGRR